VDPRVRELRWDPEALEEPLQLIAGRACLVASGQLPGLAHPGTDSSSWKILSTSIESSGAEDVNGDGVLVHVHPEVSQSAGDH